MQSEKYTHRTIVKLKTEYYKDSRSGYVKKVLTTLKRKSSGYDLLLEEINNIDARISRAKRVYELEISAKERKL